MAKKPSSGAKRAKRPVNQSAAKGGGIMSLNKSNTSPFMKAVIIAVIIAMVTLSSMEESPASSSCSSRGPQAAKVDPVVALQTQYNPQIAALNAALASDPASYTLLVNLANVHMNYVRELKEPQRARTATLWRRSTRTAAHGQLREGSQGQQAG